MKTQNVSIPIRNGYPDKCIGCGGSLHKKSEYYCSKKCEQYYGESHSGEIPLFLSKWKIRKYKSIKDPLIEVRRRARRITQNILRDGKLKKGPCTEKNGVPINYLPYYPEHKTILLEKRTK